MIYTIQYVPTYFWARLVSATGLLTITPVQVKVKVEAR